MVKIKPEEEKALLKRFKDMVNFRDEDYFIVTALTILPIAAASITSVLLYYLSMAIWGVPVKTSHGKLIISVFFLMSSITCIIWVIRRQMPGSFFTVRRGNLTVIVGAICAIGSLFYGFYYLLEALKIMLGF